MIHRPSALGWGGLAGAALAASAGPLVVQLAFAVVAIGVVGMAHGASDLAVVAPERRSAFLLCYGAVSVVCLAWWVGDPAVAVPAFLLASAIHFALEDAPIDRPVEPCARGIGLVAAPATFHQSGLAKILALAGMVPPALPGLVAGLALGGVLCAATLVWFGWVGAGATAGWLPAPPRCCSCRRWSASPSASWCCTRCRRRPPAGGRCGCLTPPPICARSPPCLSPRS